MMAIPVVAPARTAPLRVAVISTHVIQHFSPLYRRLSERPELRLRVVYASRAGLKSYRDPGFGIDLAWDSDLTSGYDHVFLPNASTAFKEGFFALEGTGVERCLRDFDPDVVFVYGYTPAVMVRAIAFARGRRRGVVMMTDSELLQPRAAWKRTAKGLLLPGLFTQVSAFMTIGDNNEAYLRRYGVPEKKLIRGGYPTDESAFLHARRERPSLRWERRAAWNVSPDDFVALFVGKLIPRKRPLDLLDAVTRLRGATSRRVVAVYAGDGELRPQLEAGARDVSECVRLLGFVNQSGLPATYAAADVLVHPAQADPHPLTVTESTLVGLPVVVSSRVGAAGPTDTAREGQNARVFPVGDSAALAHVLKGLADNPEEVARMGDATARVASETGMQACVAGFLGAVTEAAKGRAGF